MVPATLPRDFEATFRVRHQVFCEEKGFRESNPSFLEIDQYDRHATQLLLRIKDEPIGCTRFIHGHFEGKYQNLPIEEYGGNKLDHGLIKSIRASGKNYA